MTRRLIAIIAIAALAACSPAPPDNSTATATPETPGPQSKLTVALITHQPPGDTFWDVVRRGAQAAADRDGVELQYLHNPDPVVQAQIVTEAVNADVAGIAVTLAQPGVLAPAVRAATSDGIPVVALNTGIEAWPGLGVLSYFGQDDSVAGRAVGTRLTHERAHNTLCVIQEAGHVGLQARCDGAAATFDGVVQQLVVDGTRPADVKAAIVGKLQQDRGIDRILTLSAAVALTALQAKGEANSYAKVVTFDTNPAVIEAIKRGTIEWAVDQQPYLQGYLAVDALSLYLTNKNIVGGGLPTLTGPTFVDDSNIDMVAERAQVGTR